MIFFSSSPTIPNWNFLSVKKSPSLATRFIRFLSIRCSSMQSGFSSSDWFDSGFIGGASGNNSDLARITDLRGSSSPIGDWADRCSIGLSRFSLPSFLFLFPLNLSDRWSLLRTSLNFIPTLPRLDNGQWTPTHLEKDLALYLRHFCRRHPVQYFSTEMSTTQVPSFLHALSVFLSGTRLDWSWMRIFFKRALVQDEFN